jgi:hypothetical protein
MELDHDLHAVARCAPNLLKGLEGSLQSVRGDVISVVRFGGGIERQDLHRRDALGEKVEREVVARWRNASRSSRPRLFAARPQFCVLWPVASRMYAVPAQVL